ncbi:Polyketide cyclase/dehydrase [Solidesulfovibrio carbinoliphilus subsp. oakridgensis]|uniref:Polyketide cyclase/dehydrase n=2 Tax=Solidesulfovibrio carbinoliphilus TaxID=345370 RepID=G7Q3S5_9BACT|nr:Polyketide cyclase/dehydrase [Solidesulfovibrio carbinoliphilus subsp. oakridgensis]
MVRFDLVTIWRIGASLPDVWQALTEPSRWPEWWPGLETAIELDKDGTDGPLPDDRRRFVWKGVFPYRLTTDIRIVHVEPFRTIEAVASGDVAGTGVWRFAARGGLTEARHEWRVRVTAPWLSVLSRLARPLVCWNHGKIMEWGAHGLARRLGAGCCIVEKEPALPAEGQGQRQ